MSESSPSDKQHHDQLLRHLAEWTRQVGEQPPSRVAPGIAKAAQGFHAQLAALLANATVVTPSADKVDAAGLAEYINSVSTEALVFDREQADLIVKALRAYTPSAEGNSALVKTLREAAQAGEEYYSRPRRDPDLQNIQETLRTLCRLCGQAADALGSTPSHALRTEPVAWRWRVMNPGLAPHEGWCYGPEKPTNLAPYIAWEFYPLFSVPPVTQSATGGCRQLVNDDYPELGAVAPDSPKA